VDRGRFQVRGVRCKRERGREVSIDLELVTFFSPQLDRSKGEDG